MLVEIYIEGLLVDEVLADLVWEAWDAGVIPDELAAWAWCILATVGLRQKLVDTALDWQRAYGVAPAVTSAVSEYDAALLVGMSDAEYSDYMQDKTAVARGHDFIYQDVRYQIKAHRPSGKPGSRITNAGKARNYEWDVLIWIRYDECYEIEEAWAWDRVDYIAAFDKKGRISPDDMRRGKRLL